MSNFIDHVNIYVRSGNGGAGSKHFLREKYNSKGGPDGGDGGRGGHIIIRANRNLWTLLHLRYTKHIIAENGGGGSKNNSFGSDGEDRIIEVPIGTVVKNSETGEVLCEVLEDRQEIILFRGGKGGKGNSFFKTSTRQAPKFSQPGMIGIESWVNIELKVLADVGLVGFPNAGKSTLLSVLSSAKPEIADYEFTTLTPNLGIVKYREYQSFVMADIPGIIEGASQGKGLGHRFLRHIERNSVLLFMIPCNYDDYDSRYKILLKELELYNPEILDKEKILAITKIDILNDNELEKRKKNLPKGIKTVFISSVSGQGIQELKDIIWNILNK